MMTYEPKLCFFVMPFKGEFKYFYLYIKKHIQEKYHVQCERADDRILTLSVWEKINQYIQKADFIIADCTGNNPNVFYELGISHAYKKNVILITQDNIKDAPSDVRHFEFIQYSLENENEFIRKLDNALENILVTQYETLYKIGAKIFNDFIRKSKLSLTIPPKEKFIKLIITAETGSEIPSLKNKKALAEFILPKIIEITDIQIMKKVTNYVTSLKIS